MDQIATVSSHPAASTMEFTTERNGSQLSLSKQNYKYQSCVFNFTNPYFQQKTVNT